MSGKRAEKPRCGNDDFVVWAWDKDALLMYPKCKICGATDREAGQVGVHESLPSLEGRRARCAYYKGKCQSEADSKRGLAFFEHLPEQEFDRYYCGCRGWD